MLVKPENKTFFLTVVPVLTALTAIGSFIRIPIPPVPFTMQTMFVYLAGSLLGSKQGALSQGIFLLIGLIGLPVFGAGGGPAYILQPTFGYLLAFPIAAGIIGKLTESKKASLDFKFLFFCGLAGMAAIFLIGAGWLYLNINFIAGSHIDFGKTLVTGIIIFIPAELIKLAAAVSLTIRLKPVLMNLTMGHN